MAPLSSLYSAKVPATMRGVATVCLVALVSVAQAAPDPRFPKTLEEWTPQSLINPDELGELYGGDIEPPLPSWEERSGLVDKKFLWPGAKVPYVIALGFSDDELNKLEAAIKEFETRTNSCITWVKRNQEADYVRFIYDPKKCSSRLGKLGGMQIIYLSPKCFRRIGSVLHEMMHALGVIHEHQRIDRDNYVLIRWRNLMPDQLIRFAKYPKSEVDAYDVLYDYGSVMHYSAYAFNHNKKKTIMPLDPNAVIGQREGFSAKDIRKMMNMYNCTTGDPEEQ